MIDTPSIKYKIMYIDDEKLFNHIQSILERLNWMSSVPAEIIVWQLDNLIAIVDRNCQCVTDFTEDCNRLEPFEDKWRAFGWDTVKVDGHSFEELFAAFEDFRQRKSCRPLIIIANTVKGKGVSFMEKEIQWHHGVPSGKELEIARQELSLK